MTICFATNNSHKLEEVKHALRGGSIELVSLADINFYEELPETKETLEGNALQKATFLFDRHHLPCFADDTGLEVEALYGAPGVYSARYAGSQRNSEDNITLLLKNLESIGNRNARFRTVISLMGFGDGSIYFEGTMDGQIAREKRGASGFGYDPVFIPEGHHRTFAEMSLAEKNMLSHRARAVSKLVDYLMEMEKP